MWVHIHWVFIPDSQVTLQYPEKWATQAFLFLELHFQIEGFDVKRVDEYHLTGIVLDMFVRWEHRPQSTTDGRGENRNETRGESRSKPEQSKPDDSHYSEGLVSFTVVL